MSKERDKWRTVKLNPENHEKLQLICCQSPVDTSVNALANAAVADWEGLRIVKKARRK